MADKYHYDSKGNYTGKTSDDPPSNALGGCGCAVLIIIALIVFGGGKSGGGGSNGTVTEPPAQEIPAPERQTEPDRPPVYTPDPEPQEAPPAPPPPPEPTPPRTEDSPNQTNSGWVVPKEE